jgi:hypothetical protein
MTGNPAGDRKCEPGAHLSPLTGDIGDAGWARGLVSTCLGPVHDREFLVSQ